MTRTKQPKTGSKFTPGKWHYTLVEEHKLWEIYFRYHDMSEERVICGNSGVSYRNPNDAYIIAKAPEMYEALDMLASQADYAITQGQIPLYARQPLDHWITVARQIKREIDGTAGHGEE